MIFMNDILTVIKMHDEEFTPFVKSKVEENVVEFENSWEYIERADMILNESFKTTMRIYKPAVM